MSFYEINNKDIASVVNYLKIFHPDKPATEEYATAVLLHYKEHYHEMSMSDPAEMDKLLKDYESSKSV